MFFMVAVSLNAMQPNDWIAQIDHQTAHLGCYTCDYPAANTHKKGLVLVLVSNLIGEIANRPTGFPVVSLEKNDKKYDIKINDAIVAGIGIDTLDSLVKSLDVDSYCLEFSIIMNIPNPRIKKPGDQVLVLTVSKLKGAPSCMESVPMNSSVGADRQFDIEIISPNDKAKILAQNYNEFAIALFNNIMSDKKIDNELLMSTDDSVLVWPEEGATPADLRSFLLKWASSSDTQSLSQPQNRDKYGNNAEQDKSEGSFVFPSESASKKELLASLADWAQQDRAKMAEQRAKIDSCRWGVKTYIAIFSILVISLAALSRLDFSSIKRTVGLSY